MVGLVDGPCVDAMNVGRGRSFALGVALSALAIALLAMAGVWKPALDCGGDSGLPYAADGSARGAYCDALTAAPLLYAVFALVPPAVVVAIGAHFRTARGLLAGVVVGAALAVAPSATSEVLSPECAPDAAQGRPGDCQRFETSAERRRWAAIQRPSPTAVSGS
jgi:hypothetical protein